MRQRTRPDEHNVCACTHVLFFARGLPAIFVAVRWRMPVTAASNACSTRRWALLLSCVSPCGKRGETRHTGQSTGAIVNVNGDVVGPHRGARAQDGRGRQAWTAASAMNGRFDRAAGQAPVMYTEGDRRVGNPIVSQVTSAVVPGFLRVTVVVLRTLVSVRQQPRRWWVSRTHAAFATRS